MICRTFKVFEHFVWTKRSIISNEKKNKKKLVFSYIFVIILLIVYSVLFIWIRKINNLEIYKKFLNLNLNNREK